MEAANSRIAIVTETLCCMSDRDCEAYGVRMIPLACQVGSSITGDRVISSEQPVPDGDGRSIPPTEEAYRAHFAGLLAVYDGVPKGGTAQTLAYALRKGLTTDILTI